MSDKKKKQEKYTVLVDFLDLQDKRKKYVAGDEYPRTGLNPTKARIAELKSDKNILRKPLIK